MTDSITTEHLEYRVRELNDMFNQEHARFTPIDESVSREHRANHVQTIVQNPGTFWLDWSNGGVALYRNTPGGGNTKVTKRGTKRETWDRLIAFADGAQLMHLNLRSTGEL